MLELLLDALRGAILISGLVVVMMMLIESFNLMSEGKAFTTLRRSGFAQVLVSALLGAIPGCVGGFAAVSLYTHRLLSFGALLAMMIATTGDEAFMMLALFPGKALLLSAILFALAIVTGLLTDKFSKSKPLPTRLEDTYEVHDLDLKERHGHDHGLSEEHDDGSAEAEEHGMNGEESGHEGHSHEAASAEHDHGKKHLTVYRVLIFIGVVVFLAALLSGNLECHEHLEAGLAEYENLEAGLVAGEHFDAAADEQHSSGAMAHAHEHGHEERIHASGGIELLSEEWMFWVFAAISLVVLGTLVFASDHFVKEHLWEHIITRHLPSIFAWTFGSLFIVGLLLHFVDIEAWIGDNQAVVFLVAIAVGLIPQSGPHLIFVSLFASGVIPFEVLLANSIVQDGHASLPLLADSKLSFLKAKAVKLLIALIVFLVWALIF